MVVKEINREVEETHIHATEHGKAVGGTRIEQLRSGLGEIRVTAEEIVPPDVVTERPVEPSLEETTVGVKARLQLQIAVGSKEAEGDLVVVWQTDVLVVAGHVFVDRQRLWIAAEEVARRAVG